MIENATKDQLADVARLLALNIGYYHEKLSGTGHRAHVCKDCARMPKPNRDAIEQEEAIFNYLTQSHISAKNTARLRTLASSSNLERRAFERQNLAFVDLLVDPVVGGSTTNEATVVDASSRFVAQGGRWQPSPSLEQRILRAALGELKRERL